MSAHLALERAAVEVQPGTGVTVPVVVTNTGSVVDAIRLDVVGLPDGWARVEPEVVRLLPGRSVTVQLVVDPPRSSATAPGPVVLGVRARCQEDVSGNCVEEGLLQVLPFHDVTAELVPRSRTARGLRRASFVVAVDNRGNAAVTVGLDALDPDQNLLLAVQSPELVCAPGTATFGTVLVRAQRRYWRGAVLTKGFVARVVVPDQDSPIELPGSLSHRALLPQALPRLASRAALLAAGLVALLLLLQPQIGGLTVREATEASVDQAVAPVADRAAEAAADAEAARRAAEDANARLADLEAAPTAVPAASPSPTPPPPPAAAPARPSPFSTRLQTAGAQTGPFLRVPADTELLLAGFLLQPNGDRGEMALLRDGVPLVTARLGDTQVFDFPAPLRFGPASTVQLTVVCRNPTGEACDTAVLLTGTSRVVGLSSPPPAPGAVAPAPAPAPEPARTAEPLPSRGPTPAP